MLELIDFAVAAKTTWGTRSLIQEITKVYMNADVTVLEMQVYSQAIKNFEAYCIENNITSIGRNQFTTWFHAEVRRQGLIVGGYDRDKVIAPAAQSQPVVPKTANANESPNDELTRLREENRLYKEALATIKLQLAKTERILSPLKDLLSTVDTEVY
jgi:hypothetical protein